MSPPQPAVNLLAGQAAGATQLGPLLGADRLEGTLVDLEHGEGSGDYHYVYGREVWLLVLAGAPTLRHPQGEDGLVAGDLVCLPEGPAGAHRLHNRREPGRGCCPFPRRASRPTSATPTPAAG